jgi:hypothetical protein
MKKVFLIPAVIFILYATLILYVVRLLWKHNMKFLSVFFIAVGIFLGYIFYPMIQPLFF